MYGVVLLTIARSPYHFSVPVPRVCQFIALHQAQSGTARIRVLHGNTRLRDYR